MRAALATGLVATLALAAAGAAGAAETLPAIAVVVARDSHERLDLEQLALVFRRKRLVWEDGSRIHPVNLPAANPLRQRFSRLVLGAAVERLESYWNDQYFHGIAPPFVLGSDEAVLRFVAQTPGAIGYVDYCEVAGRARIVLALGEHGVIAEDAAAANCAKHADPPAGTPH